MIVLQIQKLIVIWILIKKMIKIRIELNNVIKF
jgi:hypothetical protein